MSHDRGKMQISIEGSLSAIAIHRQIGFELKGDSANTYVSLD